ncbi:hypothetical protein CDV31_004053 [Fusarium ambrosium]|uniref:Uncharacterized protein n=1 Tax=Fusarium ambrosium TaxID=131363 RepID=A0A428USB7_9HYPO|nr:hypothetical protein CDV31_004053 [Fusarium ambrosium]
MKAEQKKLRRMVEHCKTQSPNDSIDAISDGSGHEESEPEDEEDPADSYHGLKDHELMKPRPRPPRLVQGQGQGPGQIPSQEAAFTCHAMPSGNIIGDTTAYMPAT